MEVLDIPILPITFISVTKCCQVDHNMSLYHWVAGLHLRSPLVGQPVAREAASEPPVDLRYSHRVDVEETPPDGPNYIVMLPPELLAYIFWLSLPSHYPARIPFEVTLSHVCGLWRSIALHAPNLWTKINIYSPRSSDLLTKYLQRSGSGLPLDVYIDTYQYEQFTAAMSKKSVKLAEALSKELAPELPRIRKLSLFCYSKIFPTIVLSSFLQSSALRLRHLVVKYDNPTPPAVPNSSYARRVSIFEKGSPCLFFLDTDLPDALPSTASLRNLTTLYLHSLNESSQHTYSSFVEVLTAPRSLLYLSIQGKINLDTWPMHLGGPKFELSNLKSLRLLDHGLMAVKMLLSISAPNMESLWIDCNFRDFRIFLDSPQMATAVAQNKFRALEYLTLPNDNFRLLEGFSKAFPTITHLHLPHPVFWHADLLQKALKTNWFSVRTLVLSMTRESKLGSLYSALDELLPHRRRIGYPIQTLLVDEDLLDTVAKSAPKLGRLVNIAAISPANYCEIWWNKRDQSGLDS